MREGKHKISKNILQKSQCLCWVRDEITWYIRKDLFVKNKEFKWIEDK